MKKVFLYILIIFSFTSCSNFNPPKWIIGEWSEKNNPNLKSQWEFEPNSVYTKQNSKWTEVTNSIMVDKTDLKFQNNYILKYQHLTEQKPHLEIFIKKSENEIIYFNSLNKGNNITVLHKKQ